MIARLASTSPLRSVSHDAKANNVGSFSLLSSKDLRSKSCYTQKPMNGVQFMPCRITSWREAPSGIHTVSPRESGLSVVFKRFPPIVNEPIANMLLAAIVYWRKCFVYFSNQISQQVILRVQDVVNLLRTEQRTHRQVREIALCRLCHDIPSRPGFRYCAH